LIYPLLENISYIQQIKEGFLFLVYIVPLFVVIKFLLDFPGNIFMVLVLAGNIIPIIFMHKRKKLLPYLIISLIFYGIYLIIGIFIFGLRNGE
jgi:hypothetical protein